MPAIPLNEPWFTDTWPFEPVDTDDDGEDEPTDPPRREEDGDAVE